MFEHIQLMLAQEDDPRPWSDVDADQTTTGGDSGKTGQPSDAGGGGTSNPRPKLFSGILPLLMVFVAVMIIFSFRGNRKEKKKRAQMLETLKKGDKVQTVGGIIGSVIEVRDSHIIVKVDESSNIRLRFARSAIQTVVEDKED